MWQYSHHLLHGLYTHQGPILTVANWSGQWPGLVGLLNLNGSLTKAGVNYSTLWSQDFQDSYFVIDDFDQLFAATAPDFTPVYRQVRAGPDLAAGTVLPGERLFSPG